MASSNMSIILPFKNRCTGAAYTGKQVFWFCLTSVSKLPTLDFGTCNFCALMGQKKSCEIPVCLAFVFVVIVVKVENDMFSSSLYLWAKNESI